MKKNILKSLAALACITMSVFTSCNTDAEGEIYNPDDIANCSFASSQMNVELTADFGGVVKVPVYRGTATGVASAQVAYSLDEETAEIFSITNSEVSFNDGENVGYVEVKYSSMDDLGATTKYTIDLTLADASLSPSAEGELTLQIQRKLTWETIGVGTWHSQFFSESWEQPVEKAVEGNVYRLPDCYYTGYPIIFSLTEDGQSLAAWAPQKMGYVDSTYGMVYFYATAMERDGNVLYFPMNGLVEYNGGLARLYSGFTEALVLP